MPVTSGLIGDLHWVVVWFGNRKLVHVRVMNLAYFKVYSVIKFIIQTIWFQEQKRVIITQFPVGSIFTNPLKFSPLAYHCLDCHHHFLISPHLHHVCLPLLKHMISINSKGLHFHSMTILPVPSISTQSMNNHNQGYSLQ